MSKCSPASFCFLAAKETLTISAVNQFETDLMELLFQNIDLALIGDAAGLQNSLADGTFAVGLCTADPGETATSQAASETVYTSYARVTVARSSAGWTVSGNNVSNTAATTFPQGGATGSTITNFNIGTASTGVGYLMLKGALDSSLSVSNGITPSFAVGALDINID